MELAKEAGYHILVSRSDRRPQADLYAFTIREPFPRFPRPLRTVAESRPVDLQTIFQEVYDRASDDLRIDYRPPMPPPTLSDADRQWATQPLNGPPWRYPK